MAVYSSNTGGYELCLSPGCSKPPSAVVSLHCLQLCRFKLSENRAHFPRYDTQRSIQRSILWLLSVSHGFPKISRSLKSWGSVGVTRTLGFVFLVKSYLTPTFYPRLPSLRAAGRRTCKLCASVKRWNTNEPQLVWLMQHKLSLSLFLSFRGAATWIIQHYSSQNCEACGFT